MCIELCRRNRNSWYRINHIACFSIWFLYFQSSVLRRMHSHSNNWNNFGLVHLTFAFLFGNETSYHGDAGMRSYNTLYYKTFSAVWCHTTFFFFFFYWKRENVLCCSVKLCFNSFNRYVQYGTRNSMFWNERGKK